MNILFITNVYPTKYKNKSSIVKNIMEEYQSYFDDEVSFILFDRQNFIKNLLVLRKRLKNNYIDIVHIHFGGVYAFIVLLLCIHTKTKKIITFHGTDIHGTSSSDEVFLKKIKIKINKFFSLCSFFLVDKIDFVSESLIEHIPMYYNNFFRYKYHISELGVDYKLFRPIDIMKAKLMLGLSPTMNYILFINNNNSPVKREEYAKVIVESLDKNYTILKLENLAYTKMHIYFNSCIFLLITSENEGSPNVVREALACNLPIVSVDVGDIKDYIEKTQNSFLIDKYNHIKAVFKINNHIKNFTITENTRKKFEKSISYKNTSKNLNLLYKQLI